MEVNLFAGKNLPNGAIFSVRAGAVRRQAAAANQRPFRFPSKPMDSPLKVEVFRPVGAAYVVLRPGEDQYKVQFKPLEGAEGPPISCELHVKGSKEGDSVPLSPAGEEPKETTAGAKEAKDYLESHQVMQFVQSLLQTLIKDKPVDPFAYMARHFASGYEPNEQRSPLPAGVVPEKSSESTMKPDKSQTEDEAKIEEMRLMAKDTLFSASQDGTLERVLSQKDNTPQDEPDIRDLAKATLSKATKDGSLAQALSKKNDNKETPAGKAPAKGNVDAVRALAKQTLAKASKDGSLSTALAKKKAKAKAAS